MGGIAAEEHIGDPSSVNVPRSLPAGHSLGKLTLILPGRKLTVAKDADRASIRSRTADGSARGAP